MDLRGGAIQDIITGGNLDVILDQRSIGEIQSYKDYLEEKADLTEDPAEKIDLKRRIEKIDEHLKRNTKKYGQSRKFSNANERARKSVRDNISRAIQRLETEIPPLAQHLKNTIKMGNFCLYSTPSLLPWDL